MSKATPLLIGTIIYAAIAAAGCLGIQFIPAVPDKAYVNYTCSLSLYLFRPISSDRSIQSL